MGESDGDGALARAIGDALDGLLDALVLEPVGEDRFRVVAEPGRFDRVFGGQTVAQALLAAAWTVEGKQPHSLHAYFAEAGAPDVPVDLVVDRVRDGRSMSTRRVTVSQGERPLLVAIASFHANPPGVDVGTPAPAVVPPVETPTLQHWARDLPEDRREQGRIWIDRPPPVELRMAEAPNFLGGPALGAAAEADGVMVGPRSHWMRLPRDVGDDPLLHTVLLAYASDYLLLDMVPRAHPEPPGASGYQGFSLDHAIWFHRPVRFDRWHLHTQQATAVVGHRGLVRGEIHDEDGRLVASVAQEVLVRPAR